MIVQIYEIQTPDPVEELVSMGVDHIGTVLLSQTDGPLPEIRETIRAVRDRGAESSLIPLFNEPEAVFKALDYYRPDMVHFCETLVEDCRISAYCRKLISLQQEIRNLFPDIRIIRSIPIEQKGASRKVPSLEIARLFEPFSDFFLTDTLIVRDADSDADQPVCGFVGITGITCDWDSAAELVKQSSIPVILAGGISPENVEEAIAATRPAGVDSCTCTNAMDENGKPVRFRKDMEKVARLIKGVKNAKISEGGFVSQCTNAET